MVAGWNFYPMVPMPFVELNSAIVEVFALHGVGRLLVVLAISIYAFGTALTFLFLGENRIAVVVGLFAFVCAISALVFL